METFSSVTPRSQPNIKNFNGFILSIFYFYIHTRMDRSNLTLYVFFFDFDDAATRRPGAKKLQLVIKKMIDQFSKKLKIFVLSGQVINKKTRNNP